MGVIFFMSSQRGQDIPSFFPNQDIVYHLGIYALLAMSFGRALFVEWPTLTFIKIVCLCGLFGLLYGVSDEFHQQFVPGRSCNSFDLAIDTIGSFLGGFIIRWL